MPIIGSFGAGSKGGFGRGGAAIVEGIEYLVIAGGGGSSGAQAGGGGAGGYRLATTIPGESSGGNSPLESTLDLFEGDRIHNFSRCWRFSCIWYRQLN
jgi:hypothetical protein